MRDMLFISTKAGFTTPHLVAELVKVSCVGLQGPKRTSLLNIEASLSFTRPHGSPPLAPCCLPQAGRIQERDVLQNMYSLHPAYLEASLELSLERLNLQAVRFAISPVHRAEGSRTP